MRVAAVWCAIALILPSCSGSNGSTDAVTDTADVAADVPATSDAHDANDVTIAIDAFDAILAPDALDVIVAPDAADAAAKMDALEVTLATDASDALVDGPPDVCATTLCSGLCVDTTSDPENCGSCDFSCSTDMFCAAGTCEPIPPPRLIAPMSTASVTSQRPTLHWLLASGTTGAHVEICADRACALVEQSFDATGSSGTPATALVAGVHFWHARTYGATVYSVVWEFWVGARSAAVNSSWGTTLDVNGDGFADVIVGAQMGDSAYVYLGSAAGLGMTPMTLSGPTGETLGWSVASAGDVNGDGYGDVVVGAYGTDGSGGAFVYLGNATGVATTPATTLRGGTGVESDYGNAVASAGDVNGDGYGDVVVGAYFSHTAFVYLGSASGTATSPMLLIGPAGSYFGISVASAGDVNGDGFSDVVVGAYYINVADVYLGSPSGLPATPSTSVLGPAGAEMFGIASGAGDLDGDGYADIVVSATGAGTQSAYVYRGSASGVGALATTLIAPPTSSNGYGDTLGSAGDLDGDGFMDLVVGTTDLSGSVACLYYGGATGVGTTPVVLSGVPSLSFTNAVAGVGDVNADGFADLVAGQSPIGEAYVYLGQAHRTSSTPTILAGPPGSYFGSAVARGPTPARSTRLRCVRDRW